MPAATPRLQPHQATATARRPSDGIAQTRSTLRAIALADLSSSEVKGSVPCAIVFNHAECELVLVDRSALSALALNSSGLPPRPSRSRRQSRLASTPTVAQACAFTARTARLLGSRTSEFRLAGSSPIAFPSISASSRDFAEKSEPSCPNASPESPRPTNRASMASPDPSHRCRKVVPRSPYMLRLPRKSCYSANMRCGNSSLRMRLFTPVQANACGSKPEPLTDRWRPYDT